MKILITAQKGGVGKSTLAASLAASWADQGVCLLDLDPQATASQWVQQQPRPGLQAVHSQAMAQRDVSVAVLQTKQALRAAEREAPLVVADLTWGRFLPHALLVEFDAVVVPVSPSALELQSTLSFLNDCAMVFKSMQAAAPQLVVVPYKVHTQQGANMVAQHLKLPMPFELTQPVAFDMQLLELDGLPPYLNEMPNSPAGLGMNKVALRLQQLLAQRQALRAHGGFAAVKNQRNSRSRLNSPLTLLDQFMLTKQGKQTPVALKQNDRPKRPDLWGSCTNQTL